MDDLRYKGRFITKKQYKRRLKQIEGGRHSKKLKVEYVQNERHCIIEGCRIIDLKVMSSHLYCTFCKEILSLDNTEDEKRRGLASIFLVRCHKCLTVNDVPTGNQHPGPTSSYRHILFDVNTKAALGAIHSGLGHTAVNKFLKVMNIYIYIASLSASTFKRYEREMGSVIETVAKESCNRACDEERALTLARLDELRKRLPQGVDSNFLTPDRAHRINCHINVAKEACAITQDEKPAESVDLAEQKQRLTEKDEDNINRPEQDNSHNSLENSLEINEKLVTNACLINFNTRYNDQESTVNTSDDVNNNELVRVFGTFDVGWDTRSSGHMYDSLCGTGHVFGPESGKVMAWATRNRACRMCDLGHPKSDHDCRLNYFGYET